MIVDKSIRMPFQYDGFKFQNLCKSGRPVKKSADIGAEVEGGSSMQAREREIKAGSVRGMSLEKLLCLAQSWHQ